MLNDVLFRHIILGEPGAPHGGRGAGRTTSRRPLTRPASAARGARSKDRQIDRCFLIL